MSISNSDDVIDSRDVISRIEELETERQELADKVEEASNARDDFDPCEGGGDEAELDQNVFDAKRAVVEWDGENGDELKALKDLAEEAEGYADDWKYGEQLIRDSYFKDFAMELAEDIGAIDKDGKWPNTCIDWDQAARELRMDYTSVTFDGVDYWIR